MRMMRSATYRWIGVALVLLLSGVSEPAAAQAGLIGGEDVEIGQIDAPRGLVGNPMFRSAVQQFKKGPFTNIGRAVTKHPNIVGLNPAKGTEMKALLNAFGSKAGINRAAADAVKNIMRTGVRTTKNTTLYGQVVDFKLANGIGIRFSATTNEFLQFLGRGVVP